MIISLQTRILLVAVDLLLMNIHRCQFIRCDKNSCASGRRLSLNKPTSLKFLLDCLYKVSALSVDIKIKVLLKQNCLRLVCCAAVFLRATAVPPGTAERVLAMGILSVSPSVTNRYRFKAR